MKKSNSNTRRTAVKARSRIQAVKKATKNVPETKQQIESRIEDAFEVENCLRNFLTFWAVDLIEQGGKELLMTRDVPAYTDEPVMCTVSIHFDRTPGKGRKPATIEVKH